MRRLIWLVTAMSAMLVSPAAAADRPAHEREYLRLYAQDREQNGKRSPGCNLVSDRYDNRCAGKATRADVVESIEVLERHVTVPSPPKPAPQPATSPAPSSYQPVPTASYSGGGGSCGSGYRGMFQFDCQTWQSVGGTGDPAAASPEEQRRRAEILQSQRGNQPWPVCGQGGASLDQIAQCESGGDPTAVGGG